LAINPISFPSKYPFSSFLELPFGNEPRHFPYKYLFSSFWNYRIKPSKFLSLFSADADSSSDAQALSALNRFLGAQVLLTGVESMMNSGAGDTG